MRTPISPSVLFLLLVAGCAGPGPLGEPNRDPHGPADVAQYIAALEDSARDEYLMPEEVLAALALAPNAVVADVGCGPGYFTLRAARLAPAGVVYGVDVEPRQLDRLNEHLTATGIPNVVPVLATVDDPRLPPRGVDVILVIDTYHHFDDRPAYLAKLRAALKPGGRLVDIDFHAGELPVGPPPDHKFSREQSVQEIEAAGFTLVEEPTFLPYHYFLIFEAR